MDDEFAEIADSVPGFGGFYFDVAGRLTVVLREPTEFRNATRLDAAIRAVTAKRRLRSGRPAISLVGANVVRGDFSFRQLYDVYRGALNQALPLVQGLVTTDIDEVRNRIVIGVEHAAHVESTKAVLEAAGISPAFFLVVVSAAPRPNWLLSDPLRPVPGGARIFDEDDVPCTMGFNLLLYLGTFEDPVSEERFFTTTSHCSSDHWALDYSQMFQGGSFAATEYGDPAGFPGSPCPFQKICRYSDASLFVYHADSIISDDGQVAYPSTEGDTSFSTHKTITSVDIPYYGMAVHMIGATSGRRVGNVIYTCLNVYSISGWGNRAMLCQNSATYLSADGDSGAPVITLYGDGTVSGTGQHWGNVTINGHLYASYFSPMFQVLDEFYFGLGYLNFSPVVY